MDRLVALGARDDWMYLVDHWTALRARLVGSGGNALTGMPGAAMSSGQSVIDLHVSDLLEEITQSARFYGKVLWDEAPRFHGCNDECAKADPPISTEDCPDRQDPITTSFMPGLLRDVAQRFGHFTEAEDEQIALAFCDDASDYRERVRKTLERPAPPIYVGPCQEDNCAGELYLREGRDAGTCRECGAPFTLAEQRKWLNGELEDRLMTMSEVISALVVLGTPAPVGTVKSWISRQKLPVSQPVIGPETQEQSLEPALYRLADAQVLAERRRVA